jgi:hypothetical protein
MSNTTLNHDKHKICKTIGKIQGKIKMKRSGSLEQRKWWQGPTLHLQVSANVQAGGRFKELAT